jgi:hypothetical protein
MFSYDGFGKLLDRGVDHDPPGIENYKALCDLAHEI